LKKKESTTKRNPSKAKKQQQQQNQPQMIQTHSKSFCISLSSSLFFLRLLREKKGVEVYRKRDIQINKTINLKNKKNKNNWHF